MLYMFTCARILEDIVFIIFNEKETMFLSFSFENIHPFRSKQQPFVNSLLLRKTGSHETTRIVT